MAYRGRRPRAEGLVKDVLRVTRRSCEVTGRSCEVTGDRERSREIMRGHGEIMGGHAEIHWRSWGEHGEMTTWLAPSYR